ncbi:MAG: twin-arginine translocation signal domain-containing protein [Magnetococcales bacterium]|nr:twin-arginine translocation signal domain-containing protein [Magnetococcales bacterium]
MNRRDFIKKSSGVAAVAASTILGAPAVMASSRKHRWQMVSTWPPNFPLLQTGVERFANRVKELTDGQLTIQVYAAGELIPAFGSFEAVSKGMVQAGSGASYYWAGKSTAAQWFTSVPFGLNAQGMNAWLYAGGGLQLWEETYAPFNLIPRPSGNTGLQMGGWFNREINSIDDFKGLKMRIPGLGGKVIDKVGGTPVLLPGGEIFTSLERGVIDATEFVGPLHDMRMGFYKAAKYYYTPGWHEPGSVLEVFFNKQAYEKLPKSLQGALDAAAAENNIWMLAEFDAQNGAALEVLINQHKVSVRRFSKETLDQLRTVALEVREEEAQKDAQAKKVHLAFNAFQEKVGLWGSFSEQVYYDLIAKRVGE